MDYNPCDECKEQMNRGITLIGITDRAPDNRPAICQGENGEPFYPSGKWAVVTEDAVRALFKPDAAEGIINNRGANVLDEILDDLLRIYESHNI